MQGSGAAYSSWRVPQHFLLVGSVHVDTWCYRDERVVKCLDTPQRFHSAVSIETRSEGSVGLVIPTYSHRQHFSITLQPLRIQGSRE